jgi:hypothetical protein
MGKIRKIIPVVFVIVFILHGMGYSQDKKEEMKQYMAKISPILTDVQLAARNMSQKFWSPESSGKQMKGYIDNLRSLVPPESMVRQHKMILLSLQKLRSGFYALSKGNRALSITLVRRGAELLRTAVKDIVDFAKKEGLVKEREQPQVAGNKGANK